MKFEGEFVTLPWADWENVRISPKGIQLGDKGFFTLSQLELAIWKARCLDRRKADTSGIMRGFLKTEI